MNGKSTGREPAVNRPVLLIAAISDTHGHGGWAVPPCDVFIHAGDMTACGTLEETAEFAARLSDWFGGSGTQVILVPGNHDACFETQEAEARALFAPNVHVLVGEGVTLRRVRFYGSPWTPRFMRWHFMKSEEELREHYQAMPAEVDVLVTHGPPRGILDPGWREPHAGSTALRQAVESRRVAHYVFGHLHGAGGKREHRGSSWAYNVAACDDRYIVRPSPITTFEAPPSRLSAELVHLSAYGDQHRASEEAESEDSFPADGMCRA